MPVSPEIARLRDWHTRHAPGSARLHALEARVVRAWRAGPSSAPTAAPPSRGPAVFTAGALAGVAAALLAMAAWRLARAPHTDPPPLYDEAARFARQQGRLARVFAETERVFGPSLQWVAEAGAHAELGVAQVPEAADRPLAVRLTVLARAHGRCTWERVWQVDVVTRPGGVYDLRPDGSDNRVAIWTHRLDDASALFEGRIELQTPVRLSAELSEVLHSGISRGVLRKRDGSTDYLLISTLAPAEEAPCSS